MKLTVTDSLTRHVIYEDEIEDVSIEDAISFGSYLGMKYLQEYLIDAEIDEVAAKRMKIDLCVGILVVKTDMQKFFDGGGSF